MAPARPGRLVRVRAHARGARIDERARRARCEARRASAVVMSSDGLHTALETAPPDLKAWLQTQPSLDAAWATCDRADWLLWLARRRPSDDLQERRLVGATALALRMAGASGISRR